MSPRLGFGTLFAAMTACVFVHPISAADAVTFKEKVLYSFSGGTDGANPSANVIDVNGTLYGTTYSGGGSGCGGGGCGTVFSIDSNAGVEKVLYSFLGGTDGALPIGGLIAVNGILYGTTYQGGAGHKDCGGNFGCGTVFSVDPNTGAEKVVYSFCNQEYCLDGALPYASASLTEVKGKLYGTTIYGGNNCDDSILCGTVFAVDPNTALRR